MRSGCALHSAPVVSFGELELDHEAHDIRVKGEAAHLTRLEFHIVDELVAALGALRTYDELLTAVWGPAYQGERTILQSQICHLRKKLQTVGINGNYLRTRSKFGYVISNPSAVN